MSAVKSPQVSPDLTSALRILNYFILRIIEINRGATLCTLKAKCHNYGLCDGLSANHSWVIPLVSKQKFWASKLINNGKLQLPKDDFVR